MALFRKFAIAFTALSVLSFPALVFSQEIQGKITVPPPYPAPKKIKAEKKFKDICADELFSPALLVSPEGGLSNAVVWLEGDFPSGAPSSERVVLDQSQCGYSPHVFLVPKDAPFWVANNDPIAHDIRGFDKAEMVFRFEMDPGAKPVEKNFEKPGIYVIRCGLHPWMYAFAVKTAHPFYAITDAHGVFSLKGVPAGNYQMHLWHETLGTKTVPVAVNEAVTPFEYVFKKA